jgi:hypothetical protein
VHQISSIHKFTSRHCRISNRRPNQKDIRGKKRAHSNRKRTSGTEAIQKRKSAVDVGTQPLQDTRSHVKRVSILPHPAHSPGPPRTLAEVPLSPSTPSHWQPPSVVRSMSKIGKICGPTHDAQWPQLPRSKPQSTSTPNVSPSNRRAPSMRLREEVNHLSSNASDRLTSHI